MVVTIGTVGIDSVTITGGIGSTGPWVTITGGIVGGASDGIVSIGPWVMGGIVTEGIGGGGGDCVTI